MARRAALVDTLRKQGGIMFLADGGDFVHRNWKNSYPESIASWMEMARLRYDAVTYGELEFEFFDMIDSLQQVAPLPLVVSNVEQMKDGIWQPIGQQYLIMERGGVTVGFLSAISENQMNTSVMNKVGNRLRLLPPMGTLQQLIPEVRPQVDILVLLAHVDTKSMEQYTSSLPEVDVVLGGHVTRKDEAPVLIAETILNRSGTRGQHLANTRLIVSPDNSIVDFGGKNITLTKDIPEDPVVAAAAEAAQEAPADMRRARAKNRRAKAKEERDREVRTGQPQDQSVLGGTPRTGDQIKRQTPEDK